MAPAGQGRWGSDDYEETEPQFLPTPRFADFAERLPLLLA